MNQSAPSAHSQNQPVTRSTGSEACTRGCCREVLSAGTRASPTTRPDEHLVKPEATVPKAIIASICCPGDGPTATVTVSTSGPAGAFGGDKSASARQPL